MKKLVKRKTNKRVTRYNVAWKKTFKFDTVIFNGHTIYLKDDAIPQILETLNNFE